MPRPPAVFSLAAAIVCAAAALPARAQAGSIEITPPADAWVVEDGLKVTISGTAQPANQYGEARATVTALVQEGANCASSPPSTPPRRPDFQHWPPADFPYDSWQVAGPFTLTPRITVFHRGTLCAWLDEFGTPGTTTVASAKLVPRFRVPRDVNERPFFTSTGQGVGLVSYVSPNNRRFTKFTASCIDRHGRTAGPHNNQRFTIVRSVAPDPLTGAFSLSGKATPDNSDNYDVPPQPYHGKASLRLTGSVYVLRDQLYVRGTFTLKGAALHCSPDTVHG